MTTYYLRPSGDDGNPGTSVKRAWRSLERASQARFSPGDRLLLEGGARFAGTLTLALAAAGDPARPLTIGSSGRERATIEAARGPGIVAHNVAGVRIEHLRIVGAGRAQGNVHDGIAFWMNLPGTVRLKGIAIENVAVRGFGRYGISIAAEPSDGSRSGFAALRLVQVEAHENGDAGIAVYATFRTDLPGWAHEDLYIGRCRAFRNRGIADKGGHSGNGIVISQADGALIERCVAFENGENSNYDGGGPVGIWAWDSNRVLIQRCQSYDNRSRTLDGGGFDLDGGVTNSVMRYNRSQGNAGAGFMIYQFGGARPCFGNVVHHNVSENDGRTNLGGLFAGGGIDGAVFHDNQIVIGPRGGSERPAYAAGVDEKDNGKVVFRNNRLTTRAGAPLVEAPRVAGRVRFSSNRYRADGATCIHWSGVTYPSIAAWREATGQECG